MKTNVFNNQTNFILEYFKISFDEFSYDLRVYSYRCTSGRK